MCFARLLNRNWSARWMSILGNNSNFPWNDHTKASTLATQELLPDHAHYTDDDGQHILNVLDITHDGEYILEPCLSLQFQSRKI